MTLLISQFYITFKNSLLLLILLGIVFIIYTIFIYRRTIPLVPVNLKRVLTFLRSISLILILFVLFETTLNFIRSIKTPPHIAVAIDNSASMAIKDKAGNRPQLLSKAINDPVFNTLKDQFVLKYYTFSNKVNTEKTGDSLTFTGDATNITDCIKFIKNELVEKNLAGIIILSDGNYNKGGNPIRFSEELSVPVYPVGIGSPERVPDIAIVDVEYNPYAYINETTPVNVFIRNTGYKDIKIPITLSINGKKELTKIINIHSSPSEIKETIEYLPRSPGNNKLVLSVPSQPDELSFKNNLRTIYIDVFKAKLNVHLFAGSLSPEISFLKRHISSSDRYVVTTFVEKSENEFYQINDNEIENADIFIFQNFPTINTSARTLNRLLDRIQKQSIPIFLVLGKNVNFQQLSLFNEYLPIKANVNKINETLVYPMLSEKGKNDQLMRISSQNNSALSTWSKLPPVYTTHLINQLWANSDVLAFYKTSLTNRNQTNNNPLIVIRTNGKQKSAAVLAYGIWRWDLLMWGVDNNDDAYYNFVNNLLRWLEIKKEIKPVLIKTDNQQYNFGDPIKIDVEILNEALIPNDQNELVLSLKHNQTSENIAVYKSGENIYTKILYLDKSGDFELSLIAQEQAKFGNNIDKALFSIGEYSSELNNTHLQKSLLEGLALTSGGKYISSDSLYILAQSVQGSSRETSIANGVEFWNNRILLFCIIISLTMEWFLRKKKGML